MSTFKEKMMAKKIKKIKSLEEENKKLEARIVHLLNDTVQKRIYNDLLDNNMYQEGIIEDLKEQVAQLKTRGPDIWKKGIVGVEKYEFDNMKTRVEVQTRKIKRLEEENKKLKEKGKCHKDKRITARSCDDRAEYNRQVMYLKSNPECEFIPERKWTKKSKQGSS